MKSDRGVVTFTNVRGVAVPHQPWPQVFHVTRSLMRTDAIEVRPLTLTGFAKGVARNFVAMNFWRLCWTLRGLGFLKTEEAGWYRWRDLTLRFWRYQQVYRFKSVRALRRWCGTTKAAYRRLLRRLGRPA